MIPDLDILLTALYVELTDRIIVSGGFARRGPGRPPQVTDAELVCLAVRLLCQPAVVPPRESAGSSPRSVEVVI
jgi:hypothetical protein